MSKGGGSQQSAPTTTTTAVDPQVKAAYFGNLDYAQQVANSMDPRQFAGFDPSYQAGEAMATQNALYGTGTQNLGTAADLTSAVAAYAPQQVGYNQEMVDQYMNPYTNEVINTGIADLERSRQGAVQQMGQRATAAKAFGGSRQGVAEALTNQEYGTQAGNMIAGLRSQGFNQAVQNAMNAQQLNQSAGMQGAQFRLNAANQLGNQGLQQQSDAYANAANMMSLGQNRQSLAQQQMDASRNLGLERLGIMQSALGLQPANMGQTSSSTQPIYSNTGANVLGGAMAGNALLPGYGGMAAGALLGLL
jgi:hypothetical protein